VLTRAFISAGDLMARVLGAEGYRFVAIDHPISSATTDELAVRARTAVAQSRALLVA
jgi:hypothetical protein